MAVSEENTRMSLTLPKELNEKLDILAGYQNITGIILANADSIMTNKVKNIETVAKMLDTQGEVVKKMLKDSIDGNKKEIENLGS